MIVSCAPFRVSFAGGGSDIPSFYRQRRGAVLCCAIAKYSFIVVHPLINALYAHRRIFVPKETLAREACMLEIERLGEPIGKQDQYAAAYGGVNLIEFERHGGVTVRPLLLSPATLAELEANLMLLYTGTQRDARAVLSHQVAA